MKLLFKLTLVLILASVSFTSCTKKLTQEEVQQINTATAETTAEYEKLKTLKEEKSSTERKLKKEEKRRYKKKQEKKKMRKKLGYADEEETASDSTSTKEAAPAEK